MKRAVRAILRLIGFGLGLFGVMELGLEWVRHRMRGVEMSVWHCVAGGVLMLSGILVLALSGRLAERWTDDFDD